MNNQDVKTLFAQLTRRFGKRELKEGQDMGAIELSWQRSLSGYRVQDVTNIVQTWCDNAKYQRWPEAGEILDIMKERQILPESWDDGDKRPPHVRQAERDYTAWFENEVRKYPRMVNGEWIWRHDFEGALYWILGTRDKYRDSAAHAWLNGLIPNEFPKLFADYMKRCWEGKKRYQAAKMNHGIYYANTMGDSGLWRAE